MATMQFTATTRRPGHFTIRTRFFAFRLNYRVLIYSGLAAAGLFILAVWAMTLGSLSISFADVVRSVLGRGAEDQEFVVQTLRLPRILSAILVGAALGMSGGIFQGLVRNPLVSPDIIGINAGASLVAVFWIIYVRNSDLLPLAAFAGALGTAAAIYLLTWKGGINTNRLILVGIGIASTVTALTTLMIVRNAVEVARAAEIWRVGSLYGSTWRNVWILLICLAVLTPVTIVLAQPLRAMQLGDDVTRGLGLSLERTRLTLMLVGFALAGVAVAVAGPIGFVALMVPHVARMIAGPLSGSVMIFTGLVGAIFLLAADTVAQHFLPVTLPAGVVTAAVGGPYFLFLLYRFNVRM